MLQLSRNGLILQSLTSLDESQGSSNVKVSIQNDATYTNYSTQLHYGYYVHGFSYKKGIARYENGVFILPREAFEQYGLLNLSVLLVSSDEELMTNQVQFIVQAAPRGDMVIDDIPSAQQQVLQLVQTTLDQYANTINLNKNEIAVLNTRMDSFTQLQEGSTTGDAELIDGRVGYDGKTYKNIGGAIRGQVSQLSDDKVDKTDITLGLHTDGLVYIFIGGVPMGNGLNISDGSIETPAVYGQPITDNSLLKMKQQNTAILGVKLDTKPTQSQTISILSDSNVVTFDKETLEFTSDNWNEYQFVTITSGMIDNDTSVNIILRNSDELLTDKNITVYIIADSYSVDTTIPTEDQHVLTSADFEAVTAVDGYGIICKKYIGEYTNIKVPSSMEYNGKTYSPVSIVNNTTFKDNASIQYVEFEDGAKTGGTNFVSVDNSLNQCFYGCTSLIGVELNSLIPISLYSTFRDCSNLKFVKGIENADISTKQDGISCAFKGCTSLEYVQDLSEITTNRETGYTDGFQMFYGCTSLKKVYGLPQLTNMTDCFNGCTSLEEGFVPSTVGTYGETTNTIYGSRCFTGCANLKKITVLTEVATPDLPTSLNNNCVIYAIEGSSVYSSLQSKIASLPTATLLPYGSNAEGGNIVTAWGDSTTSYNNNWIDWVQRLGEKLDGFSMKNQAVSGEYTTSTSARQGGNTLKVGAFTIPADTTSVQITLSTEDGHTFGTNPVFSGGASFNPCVVNGVKGTIANAGSGKYTFTRLEAGSETQVEENTIVTSLADTVFNNENSIMLINLGTNSGWDENADVLLNQVQLMVNHFTSLGGTKYIICGLSSGKHLRTEAFKQVSFKYEEKASSTFGEHWLNMREYLIENGLTENGLTASKLDNERIAQGLVPASLLGGGSTTDIKMYDGETVTDDCHFNCYGANSQSLAFYNKGKALGYWD